MICDTKISMFTDFLFSEKIVKRANENKTPRTFYNDRERKRGLDKRESKSFSFFFALCARSALVHLIFGEKKNLAGQETVGIILKRPSETMDGLGTP